MNFLEGLRRSIVIVGAFCAIVTGTIAWKGFGPPECWASATPPTEFSPWHMDWEKFPKAAPMETESKPENSAAAGAVALSDLSDADLIAAYKKSKSYTLKEVDGDPFSSPPVIKPTVYEICEPELKYFTKRLTVTVGWIAAITVGMLLFWMVLRWVLVGFFPSWSRAEVIKR